MNLQEKFYRLENLLKQKPQDISIHSGVPFILQVYSPDDEYFLNQQKNILFQKLKDSNIEYRRKDSGRLLPL